MLVCAFLNIPAFSFFVYIYVCIAFSRQQDGDAARILRPHILYAAAISGYMPASCAHIFNAFLNVFLCTQQNLQGSRQQEGDAARIFRPHIHYAAAIPRILPASRRIFFPIFFCFMPSKYSFYLSSFHFFLCILHIFLDMFLCIMQKILKKNKKKEIFFQKENYSAYYICNEERKSSLLHDFYLIFLLSPFCVHTPPGVYI